MFQLLHEHIYILGPFCLTEQWRSVIGFRLGDPSVFVWLPKLYGHHHQDNQVGTTTFANQSTLLQDLSKLRRV